MQDKIEQLELKITELENRLSQVGSPASNISAEDMKIYQKVSTQLSPAICSCSICSICSCSVCRVCRICQICSVCRVCQFCINECSCGPCIQQGGTSFGADAFGSFME